MDVESCWWPRQIRAFPTEEERCCLQRRDRVVVLTGGHMAPLSTAVVSLITMHPNSAGENESLTDRYLGDELG